MDVSEEFSKIASLICEPARAKILWYLLEGKAYTATELASFADISITSASNHLSRLLDADMVKVQVQGRYRYYAFSNDQVAYAVEALAQLTPVNSTGKTKQSNPAGEKYCRTCYDHLAGFVGVTLVETMEKKGYLKKVSKQYLVSKKGWEWFRQFNIMQSNYSNIRRPVTRQCLDWSERRPHLAGQLGADLFQIMVQKKWLKKVQFSRELIVTAKGRQEIYELFGVSLY
jgi:DNA-binding transcriptional ArsR family regulator